MVQGIRNFLLIAITALLTACGGGDGGGGETPSFAGNYQANLKMASNNCGASGLPSTANVSQVVVQNGRDITLYSGIAILTGSVDADNAGFTVAQKQIENGIEVTLTTAYRSNGSTTQYSEDFTSSAGPCSVQYTGTATKN